MLVEIFSTLIVSYLTYSWIIYPIYLSPLRKIPGPPPDYFLVRNFIRNILTSYSGRIDLTESVNKYGEIFKVYGLFNRQALMIADEKALHKILVSNVGDFIKPKGFLGALEPVLGKGLVLSEGEVHKRQRKLMNPGFSHSNMKDMVPTFVKIVNAVKDSWKNEIKNYQNDVNDNNEKMRAKIDVMRYMSKSSLDTLGIVGFDYKFNSLTTSSKLSEAYHNLLNPKSRFALAYQLLSKKFPILELLPFKSFQDVKEAACAVDEITTKMVNDKFDQLAKGELSNKNDLFSSLIKANNGGNLDESEQMKFVELKNQIMALLLAGHETIAVSITWALHYLSRDLEAQNKLRKEIVKEFPDKDFVPTLEQINSLEYLNAVCKETLRLAPPTPFTIRISNKDDIINGYLVPKGTSIFIPVFTLQNMESIWGPDVKEFKPSRWFDEHTKNTITNYNYMPFLTGPRSCIGYKMALNEMKVFLAILIRNFEFHKVEGSEVKKIFHYIYRPDSSFALWVNEIDN